MTSGRRRLDLLADELRLGMLLRGSNVGEEEALSTGAETGARSRCWAGGFRQSCGRVGGVMDGRVEQEHGLEDARLHGCLRGCGD